MAVLAMVAIVLSLGQSAAQPISSFGDTKLYERVLDRLFEYDQNGAPGVERLRYSYCNAGEMQVVIGREELGGRRIQFWRVPKGSPTVWEQLAALWRTSPTISVEEAVDRITVRRESRVISRSSPISKIIDAGSRLTFGLSRRNEVFLDGSRYEFAMNSVSKTLTLSVQGPQEPSRSEDPIVRWMGHMRAAAERLVEISQD